MARSVKSIGWQNKIVGSGTSRAGDLLANESNWRIHVKAQQDALSGILKEVGWVQQVIVNRRTSEEWCASQNVETVVDGHLRVSLALSKGEDTEVPVIYIDLTPKEEALVLATFDPISALAVADNEQLKALLSEIETENGAVKGLLDELELRAQGIPEIDNNVNAVSPKGSQYEQTRMPVNIGRLLFFLGVEEQQRMSENMGVFYDPEIQGQADFVKRKVGEMADEICARLSSEP